MARIVVMLMLLFSRCVSSKRAWSRECEMTFDYVEQIIHKKKNNLSKCITIPEVESLFLKGFFHPVGTMVSDAIDGQRNGS